MAITPQDTTETEESEGPEINWAEACKGSPLSIVVPPYIRVLQGFLMLQRALILLNVVQYAARSADVVLKEGASQASVQAFANLRPVFDELQESRESKALGVTFETFFAAQLVINLVSEVEHFFASAISAALRMYPQKMGNKTFKLIDIISVSATDELIDRAAHAVLNDLLYEKPLDYLDKLADILSIDSKILAPHWPAFVELKARRDLGVHNNWVVNEIYLRKLTDARIAATRRAGERLIPSFEYLRQAIDDCRALVDTLADALGDKWLPLITDKDQARSLEDQLHSIAVASNKREPT